jgi:hypothetical protein
MGGQVDQPAQPGYMAYNPDPDPQYNTIPSEKEDDEANDDYDDNKEFMDGIRRGFIVKVYSILVV